MDESLEERFNSLKERFFTIENNGNNYEHILIEINKLLKEVYPNTSIENRELFDKVYSFRKYIKEDRKRSLVVKKSTEIEKIIKRETQIYNEQKKKDFIKKFEYKKNKRYQTYRYTSILGSAIVFLFSFGNNVSDSWIVKNIFKVNVGTIVFETIQLLQLKLEEIPDSVQFLDPSTKYDSPLLIKLHKINEKLIESFNNKNLETFDFSQPASYLITFCENQAKVYSSEVLSQLREYGSKIDFDLHKIGEKEDLINEFPYIVRGRLIKEIQQKKNAINTILFTIFFLLMLFYTISYMKDKMDEDWIAYITSNDGLRDISLCLRELAMIIHNNKNGFVFNNIDFFCSLQDCRNTKKIIRKINYIKESELSEIIIDKLLQHGLISLYSKKGLVNEFIVHADKIS
jgi:hypothetical protein